jgi:Uri superfamily endonuclease
LLKAMAFDLGSPGTYLLLMALPGRTDVTVRGGREFRLEAGLYAYVGSARGSGGLASRLRRHATESSRKHWNVDYLVPHADLRGALVARGTDRRECGWASWVASNDTECVAGFGSSDCRCAGHLFRIGGHGDVDAFVRVARSALGGQYVAVDEIRPPGR